jgi:hypothetical protein
MISWMGTEIETARSRGSKISVCDYENNLVIPPHVFGLIRKSPKKLWHAPTSSFAKINRDK